MVARLKAVAAMICRVVLPIAFNAFTRAGSTFGGRPGLGVTIGGISLRSTADAIRSIGASGLTYCRRRIVYRSTMSLASVSGFMTADQATDEATNMDRQPLREEAIALLKGGLGNALVNVAANFVMPVLWVAAQDDRPLISGNGSAFLLDAGEGPFLVTAGHVFEGYRRCRENHQNAACIVGDLRFDIEQREIAYDQAYDVATFKVTSSEVAQSRDQGKFALTGRASVLAAAAAPDRARDVLSGLSR